MIILELELIVRIKSLNVYIYKKNIRDKKVVIVNNVGWIVNFKNLVNQ